jgi:RNA polymerase sigma-70 factor (ECF subfamily)
VASLRFAIETGEVFMQAAAAPKRVEEQFLDARPGVKLADSGTGPGAAAKAPESGPADQHEAWLAAIARGDQRAFEGFYDATLSRVVALVRRICTDPGLAEEVVEDAYVQVWREASRYDPPARRAARLAAHHYPLARARRAAPAR